ncbi:hypothetical protein Hanom_Chr12g01137821 [Helianthus anomalus]
MTMTCDNEDDSHLVLDNHRNVRVRFTLNISFGSAGFSGLVSGQSKSKLVKAVNKVNGSVRVKRLWVRVRGTVRFESDSVKPSQPGSNPVNSAGRLSQTVGQLSHTNRRNGTRIW